MPFLSAFLNLKRQSTPGPLPKGKASINCLKPSSQKQTSNSSKNSNSIVRRKIISTKTDPISQPTLQPTSQPTLHPISQLISQPTFQIEKSITNIFVAAKQLLDTLENWSRQKASTAQISDVYVRLRNEFNLACRVLTAINIDTSDLGKYPVLLCTILKITLSQKASVKNLETYLPRIQGTLIYLLHGLKSKQKKLRHNQMSDVNGDKLKPEKISMGSGIITSLGSLTVDNSLIKVNVQNNEECRASTQINHDVMYHNISTSPLRRAKTIQYQLPSVTPQKENFSTLSPSPPISSKNTYTTAQRSGISSTQDSWKFSADPICNRQSTLVNICQNTNFKSNQIENLSSLKDKKHILSSSPQPPEDLTLFLQYKTKVKKFLFSGGCNDLSIAKLRQVFIEIFAWNTHYNGVDLPDIYILDPKSGIRHELQDVGDIKDRSLLILNVEALDEIKRHLDDGLCSIKKMFENIKTVVDEQQATLQRVLNRQQETENEFTQLQTAILSISREYDHTTAPKPVMLESSRVNISAYEEKVQSIRRDVAIFRQNYKSYEADVKKSLDAVRKISENLKTAAPDACLPESASDYGRKYVDEGKKGVNEECDKIVAHVDDLQDTVEDLRKDVALRGVQPHPRQLEAILKDVELARLNLKKIKEVMKREKPIWSETWKMELERVCNDQEDVNNMKDLIQDLEEDVTKTSQTFALIEEAAKERSKNPEAPRIAGRAISRELRHISIGNPAVAKEGVLNEVRALLPNHEDRLEAIERAEKSRARGLKTRHVSEFEVELENFLEEGKLKKSGGYEEVERVRQIKDERIRRNIWDKMNGTTLPDAVPDLGIVETENIDDKTVNNECENAKEG